MLINKITICQRILALSCWLRFYISNFNKYKNDIRKFEITIYAAGISNSLKLTK